MCPQIENFPGTSSQVLKNDKRIWLYIGLPLLMHLSTINSNITLIRSKLYLQVQANLKEPYKARGQELRGTLISQDIFSISSTTRRNFGLYSGLECFYKKIRDRKISGLGRASVRIRPSRVKYLN